MVNENKTYIGDGVYAEIDDFGLILTTENGIEVTNRVVLETREWKSLLAWMESRVIR